jgi:thymidylate synthase
MRAYFGKTIPEVFSEILADLLNYPDFETSPRGLKVKEIRDCSMEIEDPMINLYTNKWRSSPKKYISSEILWYFSGTNNPKYIENYASMWKILHNPDGTVNSSYGNLIFTEKNKYGLSQYQWVIESLKRDKDSRQAFMHFNKPDHQWFGNKDQVCTLQALFHIRNNKLYMTLSMRSNDIILGFMTDWAFFSTLHYHIFLHLKEYYKDLEMGSYSHISHSMHLYEKHYELVQNMLSETFNQDRLPLLNETILNEDGSIKEKYRDVLEPIIRGEKPYYSQKTDNELINWCFSKLLN